jgi:hypothetical protein
MHSLTREGNQIHDRQPVSNTHYALDAKWVKIGAISG